MEAPAPTGAAAAGEGSEAAEVGAAKEVPAEEAALAAQAATLPVAAFSCKAGR